MRRLLGALLTILLAACNTLNPPKGLLPSQKQTISVDSELLLPCDGLPLLSDGAEGNVLKHYEQVIISYKKCAARHQGVVTLMCDTFNCTASPK
jgi:hypothetical protein